MIYEVIVDNLNPSTEDDPERRNCILPMTLTSPGTSGLNVLNIDGLGPGKSTINMRDNSIISGSIYNSSRIPARNIVFSFQFNPLGTIEKTRLSTYQFFPIASKIKISIVTDRSYEINPLTNAVYGPFYIYGYVESNEPTIFSRYEGCTISVICPDPFFRTESGVITEVSEAVTGAFEFPIGDNAEYTFEFGDSYLMDQDFPIYFSGTVDVGPTIVVRALTGSVEDFTISFKDPDDPTLERYFTVEFSEALPPLDIDDYITITCEKGNKSVIKYDASAAPGSQEINYLGAVKLDSSWPVLQPGFNMFSYSATIGGSYMRVEYSYEEKYAGV